MRWLDGITSSMDMNLSKLEDSEEQGILVCYSPWSHTESDTTERLNNNNERVPFHVFAVYFVSSFVKDLFKQFDCFGGTPFLKKLDWEGIVLHK